jgi:hypothetical protein
VEPPQPEAETLSLVFIGEFVPQLVQPSWLARLDLLPASEADAANVAVISNEVTEFAADWLNVQATRQRVQLQTTLSHSFIALNDIGRGIIASMPLARVMGMGINYDAHFKLDSERIWHSVGHRLAPKELWNTVTKEPGLNTLIIEGMRRDDHQGKYHYRVGPSPLASPYGLLASVNDHYEIQAETPKQSVAECDRLLTEVFQSSLDNSREFFAKLIEFANDPKEAVDADS